MACVDPFGVVGIGMTSCAASTERGKTVVVGWPFADVSAREDAGQLGGNFPRQSLAERGRHSEVRRHEYHYGVSPESGIRQEFEAGGRSSELRLYLAVAVQRMGRRVMSVG